MTNGGKLFPDKLYITPNAVKKAILYTKAVRKTKGAALECGGFLLRPAEDLNPLVRDVSLSESESITSHVTLKKAFEALKEITENGYEAIGWWHAHPTFQVFHSGTDKRTTADKLEELGANTLKETRFSYPAQIEDTEDGVKLILDDLYEVILTDKSAIKQVLAYRHPAFAYSLVVNLKGKCYAEIATKEYLPRTPIERLKGLEKETQMLYEHQKIPVKVVKVDDDIPIDKKAIAREARIKVNPSSVDETLEHKIELLEIFTSEFDAIRENSEDPDELIELISRYSKEFEKPK